jgi:hypothetical protein
MTKLQKILFSVAVIFLLVNAVYIFVSVRNFVTFADWLMKLLP